MVGTGLPATFTTARARAAGVHPRTLYRWRDDGEVVELSRGVFRRADAPEATYPDLLAVTVRAPRAVVCTISAAIVHGLTDVAPQEVQIAVPDGTHPPGSPTRRRGCCAWTLRPTAWDAPPWRARRAR